jgi:flavin reductase (DIM6/NTAB) family NADH-FMN oxidoreductase RutF
VNQDIAPIDQDALRATMRQWASGVTIVSSVYNDVCHGMTVSAFTSISLQPPRVLIALAEDARTGVLLRQSGIFGVTILEEGQQELSDRFAGRTADDQDRFAGLETFTLLSGAPFLMNGLAYLDCQVVESHTFGSHILFIGEVLAVKSAEAGRPLLYFNRAYRHIDESSKE